jgi:hypothetical protein
LRLSSIFPRPNDTSTSSNHYRMAPLPLFTSHPRPMWLSFLLCPHPSVFSNFISVVLSSFFLPFSSFLVSYISPSCISSYVTRCSVGFKLQLSLLSEPLGSSPSSLHSSIGRGNLSFFLSLSPFRVHFHFFTGFRCYPDYNSWIPLHKYAPNCSQNSSWTTSPLKMGQIGCPLTSVTNYQSTLRSISEEQGPHLNCGGSFKSRIK